MRATGGPGVVPASTSRLEPRTRRSRWHRFICARLLLLARHAVAARHDRVPDRQRPARRRRADDPRAVRAAGERRRAQRAARHERPAHRAVRPARSRTSSRSTSATRSSHGQPVCRALLDAVGRSAKLAVLALIMTIPLAHRRRACSPPGDGHAADRAIVTLGRGQLVDPRVRLRHDPGRTSSASSSAGSRSWRTPPGRRLPTQLDYLLLPALAMVIVYFGYIARMTRAGTIEALDADYTRTATMKGLSTSQMMRRHVLRNALSPTVAVIGSRSATCSAASSRSRRSSTTPGWADDALRRQRKDLPCSPPA